MKLPKVPKPTLSASFRRRKGKGQVQKAEKVVKAKSKSTPSVRVPQPVEDLYRDMRDRRLLLPAVGLVAAIIAVPMVMSTPAAEPPPPPVPQELEGSEAVAPAVLAEEAVGVRDYRQRLEALKSKNPFAGSFASPIASGGGEESEGSPAESTTPSTSAAPPGTTPTDPTVTAPDDGVTASVDDSSSDGNDAGEILILAPRVDVKAGRFGQPKDIEGAELGDLLPDRRKAPVVMLIGVSEDLKHATFLVSDDVSETNGDGSCRPRANDCEFLRLADGEKRTFVYEPNGRKYVVKVTDIREVVVDRRKVGSD